MDAGVMRRALEYSRHFDVAVISHCEDLHLAGDGVAHEGAVATRLGLQPIPAAAEEAMVAREVVLARQTGARVHIAHVSTAGSVALIAAAKAEGLAVTAEVDAAPLHAHRRGARGVRHRDEGQPAAAHRGRPRRRPPRAGRRGHRRDRDRSRAARDRRQGAGVRRRRQRHDRPRDGAAAGAAARGGRGGLADPRRRGAHLAAGADPRRPRRAARPGRPGGRGARRPGARSGRWSRRASTASRATRPSRGGA